MGARRRIKARDFINDIRDGLTPTDLMQKYKLSPDAFRQVLKKLIKLSRELQDEGTGRRKIDASSPTFRDLRQFVRKEIDFPLSVYDGIDQLEEGRVLDVSRNGVRIQGIGTRVGDRRTFIVRFGRGDGRHPFVFEAVCRWAHLDPVRPQDCVAGFEITGMSALDAERLNELLV